jgi:hypothetical protein
MNFRHVHTPAKGAAPKGLVICFLVGAHMDAALRKALPDFVVVATDGYDRSPTSAVLASARRVGKVSAGLPIFLVGYSAGVQTVRAMLVGNMVPRGELLGVGLFDGTHAAVPPAPWQIQVWRDVLDLALQGLAYFVATCTEMTYTKRIPEGKIGRAWPTREVLELVLGEPIPTDRALESGNGRVFVACYPSPEEATEEARRAHMDQQRIVMPHALGLVLSGHREPATKLREVSKEETPGQDLVEPPGQGPDTVQEFTPEDVAAAIGVPSRAWQDPSLPFGVRSVLWCLEELEAGVREAPPGSNDDGEHGRIRQYSTAIPYTRRDLKTGKERPIRTTKDNWCAKACSFSHFAVAHPGEAHPRHRLSGIELQTDAQERDAWISVEDVRSGKVRPDLGDLCILKRGTQAWERHVCKVRSWRTDGKFQTIGGNEDNGWRVTDRTIWDREILGFVRVSPEFWA